MKIIILVIILQFLFAGCSNHKPLVSNTVAEEKEVEDKRVIVKPATDEQVKSCEYLDDIIGTSSYYGVFATKGIKNSKEEVINKAADIGATHIVWKSNSLTYGSTSITGMAYRCINTKQ